MSDVVELSAALLRRFADFTKRLTPEELAGVARGEIKFGLHEAPIKKSATFSLNVDKIGTDLNHMTSRAAAVDYIDGLKLVAPRLKELAKALGASTVGVSRKDDIRDRIVEHTVGYRLNSSAIRDSPFSTD
jgi:hypothetical protein